MVLLFAIFLPLERLFAVRPRKLLSKTLPSDLVYYFINGLIPSVLLAVPLTMTAWAGYYLMPHRLQSVIVSWPLWQRVGVGFMVGEVGFYWGHRWAHQIPFLWRFHAVHHAPEQIYFLISSRAHPIDNAFIRLCGLIPACLLGVATPLGPSGGLVAALIVISATVWGFFIHANVRWRLGPLEWLIATPRFHHWHHTRSGPLDHNYASMLPVMDWIFGSAYLPKAKWPAAYGTDAKLPRSLAAQLLYPLRPPLPQAARYAQQP